MAKVNRGTNRRKFVQSCGAALAAATVFPSAIGEASSSIRVSASNFGPDRVVIYPAPGGEALSNDYAIEVNGEPVPVYRIESRWHAKKYSAAYFDFSGSITVNIRVNLPVAQSNPSLEGLAVLPAKYGIKPTVADGVATFTTNRHFDISFEPTGQDSPLHLFTNPIEIDAPRPGDRNVVYFGPGIHKPSLIELNSGQTLYISGGAIVKAAVTSKGDNIRIMGRGILDGNDWPHFQGPTTRMVYPVDGSNITVQDILIRGAWAWTVAPTRCDRVLISHLRICGSRCGNDDGIDPCNSSNVTIRDCFIHTDDDGIAVKGVAEGDQNPKASENIVVEGCTFWIDFANGFRLGAESRATALRNFVARNIDFIHFPSRSQVDIFKLHPEDNMPMENLVFENIRVDAGNLINLARLMPIRPAPNTHQEEARERANNWRIPGVGSYHVVPGPGPYIHNVVFRDIVVGGPHPAGTPLPGVYLEGLSDTNNVRAISFSNVFLYGQMLTEKSPEVSIGAFVSQVQFGSDFEQQRAE